jgi:hypothetical protein
MSTDDFRFNFGSFIFPANPICIGGHNWTLAQINFGAVFSPLLSIIALLPVYWQFAIWHSLSSPAGAVNFWVPNWKRKSLIGLAKHSNQKMQLTNKGQQWKGKRGRGKLIDREIGLKEKGGHYGQIEKVRSIKYTYLWVSSISRSFPCISKGIVLKEVFGINTERIVTTQIKYIKTATKAKGLRLILGKLGRRERGNAQK